MKWALSLLFVLPAISASKITLAQNISTTAIIDFALVQGADSGAVTKFLGIPFARAARFALPVAIPVYLGPFNATAYGPSCPAQTISASSLSRRSELDSSPSIRSLIARDTTYSEDCLTINVIRPAGSKPTDNLPVVVWIYGGGFEAGDTVTYDTLGTTVVTRSIALGTPVIYVSMNYRLSAFGFLASAEVARENIGNFGLYDQRVALRWVKKYICNFGGDATKITIWGQSAGSISASLQMLGFGGNTENLFRAAFMQSGAPVSVGPLAKGQKYYDFLVSQTNCTSAASTLKCLRNVSLDVLTAAINNTPNYLSFNGLGLAWLPHVDGTFLQQTPFAQLKAGKFPKIPIVAGNVDDEGTVFSLAQSNLTTDADFTTFVANEYAPAATAAELAAVATNYPSDPTVGSPFDTGSSDVVYPLYKRIAAFQGDIVFQGPRRNFVQTLSGTQKVYSYLSKVLKTASVLGSYHFSDIDTGLLTDYLINFVVALDPNSPSAPGIWPQYTTAAPNLYTFTDTAAPSVTNDTYRADAISNLLALSTSYPV
ncbi:hypothetical protein HYPSUDRAFT_46517 [Hypholoma sublateritium FD-334 SS-4]|uniref:Carboxylic ester hydrolase n=1 Tax=Hypholoma sublateritium (strain FD-334 SS-4) TaxID=945553 RepID=A0A0D2KRQ7_HYPSF|nr:hypothetical protein HYPSUDRAFT_46517 [Hypholoma sublateritium FD-334 SS-4]